MAADMGKLQKIKKNHLAHNLKKRCTKRKSQGSMIDSNGCSKTIEMKMFVVNGTIVQIKIIPIECQNQNTITGGKIGGSLSISAETEN